jgi:hypothetical protein
MMFREQMIRDLVARAPESVRAYLARAAELRGANPLNSIVASDLVAYASANMPDDDVSTSGGAMDTLRRVDFTQLAANDTIQAISSNAGDTTQTLTITGRKADGSVASETLTLNGTTAINFANTYERFLKAELSATATGSVTVRRTTGPTTIRVIAAGERGFMAMFRKLSSDPGAQKDFYTKAFWKNTHATLALTSAFVKENSDPVNRVTHAVATALDDSGSVANRGTAPGGLAFDDTDKNVPNSQNLSPGSAIGTWYRLRLPTGDPPNKFNYASEIDGQTV